jgi:hypothetical protein
MHAQEAQMRALQQRAMMLAAKQRELDAVEARMERVEQRAPPMFVISSMKQPTKSAATVVEMIPSEDERSVALEDAAGQSSAPSDTESHAQSDARSDANSDASARGSQASSTRRSKNYTSRRKNKLRV